MPKLKFPRTKSFSAPIKTKNFPAGKTPAGFPEKKPASWDGSLAEYYVKLALDKVGAVYQFEGYIGKPNTLGSIQIDFKVDAPVQVAIRVQGERWHYQQGAEQILYDEIHRITTEEAGWPVVDIDAEDALSNPIYFVNEALKLRSHSKLLKRI